MHIADASQPSYPDVTDRRCEKKFAGWALPVIVNCISELYLSIVFLTCNCQLYFSTFVEKGSLPDRQHLYSRSPFSSKNLCIVNLQQMGLMQEYKCVRPYNFCVVLILACIAMQLRINTYLSSSTLPILYPHSTYRYGWTPSNTEVPIKPKGSMIQHGLSGYSIFSDFRSTQNMIIISLSRQSSLTKVIMGDLLLASPQRVYSVGQWGVKAKMSLLCFSL